MKDRAGPDTEKQEEEEPRRSGRAVGGGKETGSMSQEESEGERGRLRQVQ